MESALVRFNGDLLSSQRSISTVTKVPSSDQLEACSDILSCEWKQFSFFNVIASPGNPLGAVK